MAAASSTATETRAGGRTSRRLVAWLVVLSALPAGAARADGPQRVVSLLPAATELVCALGRCDRLVAVDRHSNHPESVRTLPRVGGLGEVDLEALVRLRPSLVIAPRSPPLLERLAGLGVPAVVGEAATYAQMRESVLALGEALVAREAARRLLATLEDDIAAEAAQVSAAVRAFPPRVYVEVDPTPYAAAPGSFVGELLARLGLANVVPDGLGPFPRINPEAVVRADPQRIVVAARDAPRLAQRPGWRRIAALGRDGRVCAFDDATADVLMRPGPRLAEGLRFLRRCANGD